MAEGEHGVELGGESVDAEYERRLLQAQVEVRRWRVGSRWLAGVAVALLLLWVMFGRGDLLSLRWAMLALGVGAAAGWVGLRVRLYRAERRVEFYEKAVARVHGEPPTGPTGEAFVPAGHLYAADLDVVGEHSLLRTLATTRTSLGQRALAGMLLEPATTGEARARQAAVRELAPALDLRERVGLLGQTSRHDLPPARLEAWLALPPLRVPGWARGLLSALTAAWIALVVARVGWGVDREHVWRDVAVILLVQAVVALRWRARGVRAEMEAADRLLPQVSVLREGVRLLAETPMEAPRLWALRDVVRTEHGALAGLERRLVLLEQRGEKWGFLLGLLLAAGTQIAGSLGTWRARHGDELRGWLGAWAELEALLALATYAAEHPRNCWPVLEDGPAAVFVAEEMVHPLLPREGAVANDVRLGGGMRAGVASTPLESGAPPEFLLVSGSNMAGKSTLLRTLGANTVLAMAGASVPCASLRLTALQVGASLRVEDNLAEGRSRFLAEVERLRAIVTLAEEQPGGVLFLIDEILGGTNSEDRRVAAESVTRRLIAAGAIGALSTHDLRLAEIADMHGLQGANVHMGSVDRDDPLSFDYTLKPGVNPSTNALAIVRLLGLK